ncbi:hypothetical protein HMI54_009579, partial [Coelomomyces lativittatus]
MMIILEKILFARSFTVSTDMQREDCPTFAYGDEIFARPVWPHALCNYAIAQDEVTQKPLFGPYALLK